MFRDRSETSFEEKFSGGFWLAEIIRASNHLMLGMEAQRHMNFKGRDKRRGRDTVVNFLIEALATDIQRLSHLLWLQDHRVHQPPPSNTISQPYRHLHSHHEYPPALV